MKVLVIGIDSGIGEQIAQAHIAAGDEVQATSRNGKTRYHLELSHPYTWPAFDAKSFDRIYYTIGIGDGRSTRIEVMQVNCFLSQDCIARYEPALKDGGKMVVLTSGWSSITELQSGKAPIYRMSKAALNMGIAIMANRINRVQWILMHPGLVDTKMTKHLGANVPMITPEESARQVIQVSSDVVKHFSFVDYTGREVPF